jgi:hypothetical protein
MTGLAAMRQVQAGAQSRIQKGFAVVYRDDFLGR